MDRKASRQLVVTPLAVNNVLCMHSTLGDYALISFL